MPRSCYPIALFCGNNGTAPGRGYSARRRLATTGVAITAARSAAYPAGEFRLESFWPTQVRRPVICLGTVGVSGDPSATNFRGPPLNLLRDESYFRRCGRSWTVWPETRNRCRGRSEQG